VKEERCMEDYSDETLRALIRQIIAEDKGRGNTEGPKAGNNRKASAYLQLASLFKYIFTKEGFVALTAAGLIFEKDFTVSTLGLALDTGKASLDAIAVFNDPKNKENNRFFGRLAEASAKFRDQQRTNKLKYLQDLQKMKEGSIPADWVYQALTSAESHQIKNVDRDSVSAEDLAIVTAITTPGSGGFDSIFTPAAFAVDKNKAFRAANVNMNSRDLRAAATVAETNKKWLDKKIYNTMADAMEFQEKGQPNRANEQINMAYAIYNSAVKLSNSPDDIAQTSILNNLEDIEDGLKSNFQRNIDDIKDSLGEKGEEYLKDLLDKSVNIIQDKLGNTP